MRLRTAAISLDWKNTSLLFGQDKPIISPRDPTSLAQVGVSPLTGAGNLWLWQPQIRLEQRFSLGENCGHPRAGRRGPDARAGRRSRTAITFMLPRPSRACRWNTPNPASKPASSCGAAGATRAAPKSPPAFTIIRAASARVRHLARLSRSTGCCARSITWSFPDFFYNGQNVADLGALPQGFVFYVLPGPRRALARRMGAASHSGHPAPGLRFLRRPPGRPQLRSLGRLHRPERRLFR